MERRCAYHGASWVGQLIGSPNVGIAPSHTNLPAMAQEATETPLADTPVDPPNGSATEEKPTIGLGIDHGPPTPAKDVQDLPSIPVNGESTHHVETNGIHPADRSPRPDGRSPSPQPIIDEQRTPRVDDPPPPPPKSDTPEARSKPLPRGISIAQASTSSLQEVELSRNPSTVTSPPSARPERNVSVSSVSPRTPSRPTSTRPVSRAGPSTHRRTSTQTTLSLGSTQHPGSQLSTVLITPPLQVLVNSKEAKKSASFLAASQKALDLCQSGDGSNSAFLHPREIFEPLRLAISNPQTTSVPILITSLDLLSKLVSHSFFYEPNGPPKGMSPLPDLIAHTITLSYSETSPPQVALQVVKALMAIVLSTDAGMLVHQSSLLKAIRTVYNVFLLSNDGANQIVAQGGLTQMVHHVFSRVVRPSRSRERTNTVGENEARRGESGDVTPVPGTPLDQNITL